MRGVDSGCKMSLMPVRQNINGELSVDMGYYYPMSLPAQVVNLDCVRGQQQGGFTYVGTKMTAVQ